MIAPKRRGVPTERMQNLAPFPGADEMLDNDGNGHEREIAWIGAGEQRAQVVIVEPR
jgi:hypothetical protein